MEELIEALMPHTTKRVVKKKSVIYYQGEIPRFAYFILKGAVKAYSLNANGDEQVVKIYARNDVVPIPWLFKKSTHALYYYEAQTDCVLAGIDRSTFHEELSKDLKYQNIFINYLAASYSGSMVHITALEQTKAREKILTILYYLCMTNGAEFKHGKFKVELYLTHATISSLCGLTRETTALELGALKKAGIVKYTTRYYLIDKAKIEELLGEDNFANLQLHN